MGLTRLREWLFRLCQSRSGQCLRDLPSPACGTGTGEEGRDAKPH